MTAILPSPTELRRFTPRQAPQCPAEEPAPTVDESIAALPAITLDDLDRVSVQDRHDAKYLLSEAQLVDVLARVHDDYRVLEIDGQRTHEYRTQYFDTADLRFHSAHCRHVPRRFKVRRRQYLDSGLTYFEVKSKRAGRTAKARIRISSFTGDLTEREKRFLRETEPGFEANLEPVLTNWFRRVTLASPFVPERVTIDRDLSFAGRGASCALPGLVVVEIKRGSHSSDSQFASALRSAGVRPSAFSKYSDGLAMLTANQAGHRPSPRLRLVDQAFRGPSNVN